MSSYDLISLDLFSTLVYIDRTQFNYAESVEEALLSSKGFKKRIKPYISISEIIENYIKKIRNEMTNYEKETEFHNAEVLQNVFRENGVNITPDIKKIANDVIRNFFNSVLHIIKPFPELHETLSYLYDKYPLILTSNHSYSPNGRAVLNNYDLNKYFKKIVFSGELGYKKPSAKIFSYALSDFNHVDKDRIVHVGDDHNLDVIGALNFGIKSIWIKHSRYKNMDISSLGPLDGTISEIKEIVNIL